MRSKASPAVTWTFDKPGNFEAMVAIVRELCGSFPFVRVDLYSISGKTVFGEFTFYPDSGVVPFTPDRFNQFFGDLFIMPSPPVG